MKEQKLLIVAEVGFAAPAVLELAVDKAVDKAEPAETIAASEEPV